MRLLVRASTIRAPTTRPPEPKIYFFAQQHTRSYCTFVTDGSDMRAVGRQRTDSRCTFSVWQNTTQRTSSQSRFRIDFLAEQVTTSRCTFVATQAVGYAFNRILVMERQADLNTGTFTNSVLRGRIEATWLKQSNLTGGRIRHAQCFDLIFETLATPPVRLDHEIESYDGTNGVLQVAIRAPSWVAKTDQFRLRVRYGADL